MLKVSGSNAYEVYREFDKDGQVCHETHTLDISEDNRHIALIEMPYGETDRQTLTRYPLENYLGSTIIELDEEANIITYEEYYPYGSSSYRASRSQTEAPKRYRYSAKEHDNETGLYYYGSRYYISWLGRWVSADPGGITEEDSNLYQFVKSNPISYRDPDGKCGVLEISAAVAIFGLLATGTAMQQQHATQQYYASHEPSIHMPEIHMPKLNLPTFDSFPMTATMLLILGTSKAAGLLHSSSVAAAQPPMVVPRPPASNPPVPVAGWLPPGGLQVPIASLGTLGVFLAMVGVKATSRTKFGSGKQEPVDHHVYPQQFSWFFKLVDINVHDKENIRQIPDKLHDWVHNVLKWNSAWKAFIYNAIDWEHGTLKPWVTKEKVQAFGLALEIASGTIFFPKQTSNFKGRKESHTQIEADLSRARAAKAAGQPSPLWVPHVVEFVLGPNWQQRIARGDVKNPFINIPVWADESDD